MHSGTPYHKKSIDYRYQVINSRCMKKIALGPSGYSVNVECKKPIIGEDIKVMTRA